MSFVYRFLVVATAFCAAVPQFAWAQPRAMPAYVDFRTLHRFNGRDDGANPEAGLIYENGFLYGTTCCGGTEYDGGVIFGYDLATGVENVLARFGPSGGLGADGPLLDVGGTLYGTTYRGASDTNGAIYSFSSTLRDVYDFGYGAAGTDPFGGLVDVDGVLYGTAKFGGANGVGTVFAFDPATGIATAVHAFAGGNDGAYPLGGLTVVGGVLYGTTSYEGAHGKGTVFAVTPAGAESVLYAFKGGSDGAYPNADLTLVGDTLYGTTEGGGRSAGRGLGTVFAVTLNGAERVVHRFTGDPDGAVPRAGVIDVGGVLYGTTSNGGSIAGSGWCTRGCGTIYAIGPLGGERILYDFKGGIGGSGPQAELLDVGGTLYGTTAFGGINCDLLNEGCGVLFSFRP